MDATSLTIIVITTVTAIAFKWFLFRRIRRWMDADLVKGLAGGNADKHAWLEVQLDALKAEGLPRAEQHRKLEQLAEGFEQKP